MTGSDVVTTARLRVRREADRGRFDHMVALCRTIPFGKQPVVELSTGRPPRPLPFR